MGDGCGRCIKEKEIFLNQPVMSDSACSSSGLALLMEVTSSSAVVVPKD